MKPLLAFCAEEGCGPKGALSSLARSLLFFSSSDPLGTTIRGPPSVCRPPSFACAHICWRLRLDHPLSTLRTQLACLGVPAKCTGYLLSTSRECRLHLPVPSSSRLILIHGWRRARLALTTTTSALLPTAALLPASTATALFPAAAPLACSVAPPGSDALFAAADTSQWAARFPAA